MATNSKSSDPTKLPETMGQYAKVRLAHEAMMLEDARQLLAQNRVDSQSHNERMATGKPAEGDMGGIHIGDQITNQAPAAQQGLSRLATAGLLAAALAAGGAGTYGVTQILNQQAAPAPVAPKLEPQEFDIDWEFDGKKLNFGEPKLVK